MCIAISFVTLYGTQNRMTSKMKLKNEGKADFERGKTDIFRIHSNYVGPLSKIRVQHDNTGKSAGCTYIRIII